MNRLRLSLVAVVFIGMLLVRRPANAAQLRCTSEDLPPTELTDVARRAQRAAPRDVGKVTLHNACWNRDFAIAWFETPASVDSDGVQWWWDIRCDRKSRRWSCADPERARRIEVTVADDSGPVTVVGWLPENLSASRAKTIIATAMTFAIKPEAPLEQCPGDLMDLSNGVRPRLDPRDNTQKCGPAANVSITGAGPVVNYSSLEFQFDHDDHPVCWHTPFYID